MSEEEIETEEEIAKDEAWCNKNFKGLTKEQWKIAYWRLRRKYRAEQLNRKPTVIDREAWDEVWKDAHLMLKQSKVGQLTLNLGE